MKSILKSVLNSGTSHNSYNSNISRERRDYVLSGNRLCVRLVEGKNMPKMDVLSHSDPYVILQIGGERKKSNVIQNNANPRWNQQFYFDVRNPENDFLELEVWDKDTFTADDRIGRTSVPLRGLRRMHPKDVWVNLDGRPNTQLHLILTAETFGFDDMQQQYGNQMPMQQPYGMQQPLQYGGQMPQQLMQQPYNNGMQQNYGQQPMQQQQYNGMNQQGMDMNQQYDNGMSGMSTQYQMPQRQLPPVPSTLVHQGMNNVDVMGNNNPSAPAMDHQLPPVPNMQGMNQPMQNDMYSAYPQGMNQPQLYPTYPGMQ